MSPRIVIIKDGAIGTDGKINGDDLHVIEGTPPGMDGKQISTIIMTRSQAGAAGAASAPGGKRIIVRCIKTARIENGKTVVADAGKGCADIGSPDIDALTADAMRDAGVELAMIKPTIESTLKSARAEIMGNTDLSADQRARALAGIDIAIKETLKDKPPAE